MLQVSKKENKWFENWSIVAIQYALVYIKLSQGRSWPHLCVSILAVFIILLFPYLWLQYIFLKVGFKIFQMILQACRTSLRTRTLSTELHLQASDYHTERSKLSLVMASLEVMSRALRSYRVTSWNAFTTFSDCLIVIYYVRRGNERSNVIVAAPIPYNQQILSLDGNILLSRLQRQL